MKNIIVCIFIGACLSVNPVFAREAGGDGSTTEKATDIKAKETAKQKKPAKKKDAGKTKPSGGSGTYLGGVDGEVKDDSHDRPIQH